VKRTGDLITLPCHFLFPLKQVVIIRKIRKGSIINQQ
jgi:hypothetical protein